MKETSNSSTYSSCSDFSTLSVEDLRRAYKELEKINGVTPPISKIEINKKNLAPIIKHSQLTRIGTYFGCAVYVNPNLPDNAMMIDGKLFLFKDEKEGKK